jgi:hypothetical protein
MEGHADPSNESGKPKLINERYIIIKSIIDTIYSPPRPIF